MKLVLQSVILTGCIATSSVYADIRICVRNFATQGMDLCSSGFGRHKYVVPEDRSSRKICVMTYPDERCKFNKNEFVHAKASSGDIVCVLNFNQPGVTGNNCSLAPEEYQYVLDPWK